jgi:hypothetical protein
VILAVPAGALAGAEGAQAAPFLHKREAAKQVRWFARQLADDYGAVLTRVRVTDCLRARGPLWRVRVVCWLQDWSINHGRRDYCAGAVRVHEGRENYYVAPRRHGRYRYSCASAR